MPKEQFLGGGQSDGIFWKTGPGCAHIHLVGRCLPGAGLSGRRGKRGQGGRKKQREGRQGPKSSLKTGRLYVPRVKGKEEKSGQLLGKWTPRAWRCVFPSTPQQSLISRNHCAARERALVWGSGELHPDPAPSLLSSCFPGHLHHHSDPQYLHLESEQSIVPTSLVGRSGGCEEQTSHHDESQVFLGVPTSWKERKKV